MVLDNLKAYNIILASQSPRRQELLKGLNIDFTTEVRSVEEVYPDTLAPKDVPIFLSELKASVFNELADNDLIITSDTVVINQGNVLGKPSSREEAYEMIASLSANTHQVVTGVTIKTKQEVRSFASTTEVTFCALTDDEINFYIDQYKPFDKAGAYGIQEWIGYIGISEIKGSYFNVMGLPVQPLYQALKNI
ncbi:Maf family nucleotide pyrophosphatase [Halosquirtibacter xylanolyticus]|uniref:Maf family nucleotide pyrophosphatase n=1 Tax=Halosquirtibacter xylanolyticus TaxID=3374599 RepID=UPI003748AA93|nr:Maf family nucleotide pyrophosphatase [Prolixibacteraceae bacterium]